MPRRRVAELFMPTTLNHILRMVGWTLIFGRPSRWKTTLCICWTKRLGGWDSHSRARALTKYKDAGEARHHGSAKHCLEICTVTAFGEGHNDGV